MATRASKAYAKRFTAAMVAYGVLLVAGIVLAGLLPPGSAWRYLAMALPVPAMVAVVWAVARFVREADEMIARDTTEALAIGFGGGSLLTFTYGIMQTVGAPPLNWMFVWVVYGVAWLVGGAVVRARRR